ncbi:MAG: hypothetical protein FXV79_02745 [Candidatus Thioglobus sp.]|nr:MAG: hypothetical protein FXV79_02745 [Candidatus Thioglobus sp.]
MLKKIQNYDYKHPTNFDFQALCKLIARGDCDLAVKQMQTLATEIDAKNLPFDTQNYARNIIINNDNCWLGLLHWDKNAATRIHGHPERSFVYVISGDLNCTNFDKNSLATTSSKQLKSGQYSYNKGVEGRMDNFVHQINAKQKSISLHYYSDNPEKGEVFDF